MDEKQINKALSNLTDDNEIWMALNKVLTDSIRHATIVATDVAVKGEERVWQCGYARALEDLHRAIEQRRKGK